ncbi:hypothetical protein LAD67_17250 [Escherichia coli]|nr:hypothetical protein [Escherichia coli]
MLAEISAGLLICLIVLTSCVPKKKIMHTALTQRSIAADSLPLPSEAKQPKRRRMLTNMLGDIASKKLSFMLNC